MWIKIVVERNSKEFYYRLTTFVEKKTRFTNNLGKASDTIYFASNLQLDIFFNSFVNTWLGILYFEYNSFQKHVVV